MKLQTETTVQSSTPDVPPGPPKNFPQGNVVEFNHDACQFMLDLRQYGPVVQFHLGPMPFYLVNEPECVQEVLANPAHYGRSKQFVAVWKLFLGGNSLIISEGESWKRQRKLLQPAYRPQRLGAYAPTIVAYTEALAQEWQALVQSCRAEAVDTAMKQLTLRIMTKALLDAEMTTEAPDLAEATTTAFGLMEEGIRKPFLAPRWLPTAYNRQVNKALPRLGVIVQRFIDARGKSGDGDDRGDFLSILLAARHDKSTGMTDKDVRNAVIGLLSASFDTTSSVLAWQWYLLSQHPEMEARLHAELDHVLAGRAPTLEDLPRLTYTTMVFKETMRLYPPTWVMVRQTTQATRLAGYALKRGRLAFLNVYGIQRDARYFPDPERFEPERFSPENEKQIPKRAYLPFGSGPHACAGSALPLLVGPLVTATLARRYRLELAPDCQVSPDSSALLRPKFGLSMFVRPREAATRP